MKQACLVLVVLVASFASAQVTIDATVNRFTVSASVTGESPSTDYHWDFDGDGTSDAAGLIVTYAYAPALPLARTVNIYALPAGQSPPEPLVGPPAATASVTLDATPQPETVQLSNSVVTIGDPIHVKVLQDTLIPISEGSIDWGDGSPLARGGLTKSRTYSKPGRYTITVALQNALGGVKQVTGDIVVRAFDREELIRNQASSDPSGFVQFLVQTVRKYDAANPGAPNGVYGALKAAFAAKEKQDTIANQAQPVLETMEKNSQLTLDQRTRIEAILSE